MSSSKLAASKSIILIDQKQVHHRRIIKNKHGERLVGLLHEAGSQDIVIVCHGFICTKENEVTQSLTFALQGGGISTFRFDFSGNGESDGEFGYANYDKEVEDLRSIIEHFLNKEGRKTVAIVGYSKGGNIVLLYAAKYHDIGFVVNVSGRFYMHEGIEGRLRPNYMERIRRDGSISFRHENGKDYTALLACVNERLKIDMGEASRCIDRGCRVVTIHGSKDDIVELKDAKEFHKVISNHHLHVIRGAKHGYRKHQHKLYPAVLSCIKKYFDQLSATQG